MATQEADDPRLYGSALTLLNQLSHITSRSVANSEFLEYSRLMTSKGKEAAAARFPAIASHVRRCLICSAAVKEIHQQIEPSRPKAPQAQFVADWMKRKHLRVTRAQMAEFAGVSPRFMTRYFNSKDPTAFRVDHSVHEAVCKCLSFGKAARREYLAIWGIEAAALAAAVAPQLSYHSMDVERYEEYVDQLEALVVERSMEQVDLLIREIQEGEKPEPIISALHTIYQTLRDLPADVRVAEAQLRAGLFLALLQEMALPMHAAVRSALATYDDLLHHVFPMLARTRYADEYFQVLMRRIVLRRLGRAGPGAYASEDDLRLPEQADAIRRLLPRVQDPGVIASYYCQRLHTHAVAGREDAWMDEVHAVEQLVKGLGTTGASGDELEAILQYAQGIGMKRFAWLRLQESGGEHLRMGMLRRRWRSTPEGTADFALSWFDQFALSRFGQTEYDANLYGVGLPRAFDPADIQQVVSMLDAHLWHGLLDELKNDTGTQPRDSRDSRDPRDPREPVDDPESA